MRAASTYRAQRRNIPRWVNVREDEGVQVRNQMKKVSGSSYLQVFDAMAKYVTPSKTERYRLRKIAKAAEEEARKEAELKGSFEVSSDQVISFHTPDRALV